MTLTPIREKISAPDFCCDGLFESTFRLKQLQNLIDAGIDIQLVRLQNEVWIRWRLVRRADAREVGYFAAVGQLVMPVGVALAADFKRSG